MGHFQTGVLHQLNSHESSALGASVSCVERERERCGDILGTVGTGQGEDTAMSHSAVSCAGGTCTGLHHSLQGWSLRVRRS